MRYPASHSPGISSNPFGARPRGDHGSMEPQVVADLDGIVSAEAAASEEDVDAEVAEPPAESFGLSSARSGAHPSMTAGKFTRTRRHFDAEAAASRPTRRLAPSGAAPWTARSRR